MTHIPMHSRVNGTHQLGLPSSVVVWEERLVTCPSHPQPSMVPSFASVCALRLADVPVQYRWVRFPGPYGKPGFAHLCGSRLHEGAAFVGLTDAFSGPLQSFLYNASHALLMNPWYPHRFPERPLPLNASAPRLCFEEMVMAHSMYDTTIGPHTVLEVAPIVAWLLDHTPQHVPIVARLNPALYAMYAALGIDTQRLIAFDETAVYYARRMWWFRRPEEFTDAYWASLRRRLFRSPPSPLPSPFARDGSSAPKPLIVLVQRVRRRRSVSNHEELLAAVEAAFPPAQYTVAVFNGSLSLTAARALFSRALVLVGPHGGAFLNAVFMPPLSIVVELAYPDYSNMPFPPYFYLQTCGLRLFHWIVVADEGDYRSKMRVNTSDVVNVLHMALEAREREREHARREGKGLVLGERMVVKQTVSPPLWWS